MTEDGASSLRERVLALIQRDWDARGSGALPDIADDSNLFDLGVVDSLLMMEIVTVFEEVTGEMVDFLSIDPEAFFTLRGILELQPQRPAVEATT